MASNFPDPSQTVDVLESTPSGSTPDSGDTAVIRVPTTDESSDEVDVSSLERAFARLRRQTDKSFRERFLLQRPEWNEHHLTFRTEYRMLASFLLIPIIASSAGFFLQISYYSTAFSRIFLEVGTILYFGIFVAYWKGTPEGPPFLSREDGSPAPARYHKMARFTSYSQEFAAPSNPDPQPGPSRQFEPQPGPSSEPQPGPFTQFDPQPGPFTQFDPQPGPSSEPQAGPFTQFDPQPGPSREPQAGPFTQFELQPRPSREPQHV